MRDWNDIIGEGEEGRVVGDAYGLMAYGYETNRGQITRVFPIGIIVHI